MMHCHSDIFIETEEIIITEEWFLNQTICGEELVDICCTKFANVYHDIHTCTLYIYIVDCIVHIHMINMSTSVAQSLLIWAAVKDLTKQSAIR